MDNSSLTDRDVKKLQLFKIRAIETNEAIVKHMPKTTKIEWSVDRPTIVEGEIDKTAERGLVVLARQFIDNSEPIEFKSVVNILSRYHQKDSAKVSQLRKYKRAWEKIFQNNPLFGIGPPDQPLTNWEVFTMIAYGGHIHTAIDDEELFNKYESYSASWLAPLVDVQLHSMLLTIQKVTNMLRLEFIEPLDLP